MYAAIAAIEVEFGSRELTNQVLAAELGDWTAEKIEEKTGITRRFVTAEQECASDLAVAAAQKLFSSGACAPADIDYILLCTQSPDYVLPTTACLIQHRLGIPCSAGALDFNLGCSGFVYGLGLAKGLIESAQATCVLLLTAETYSKYVNRRDRSVRTLFGDAAAATLIVSGPDSEAIGPFDYGTDGAGGPNLIVRTGGARSPLRGNAPETPDDSGNWRSEDNLYMNGPEIFNFTLRAVPASIRRLAEKAGRSLSDVDLFVFHQANRYMLEHLRRKVGIDPQKFVIRIADCGNTVSSTIPIALKQEMVEGRVAPGRQLMLVGFGVGYSWASCMVRWVPPPAVSVAGLDEALSASSK